jgi:hypothetical protein
MPIKRPAVQHGKKCWEVETPAYEGKRCRNYYGTEKEANAAIDKFNKDVKLAGEWWARLTPAERLALQLVHTQASAAGLTITKIWEDYQAYQKQQAAAAASVTTPTAYEDVVTEWKRRKKAAGKSERYVYHAAADLMKFGKGQERRNIHEIMPAELDKYINSQKIQKRGKDFGKPWGLSTKRTNMSLFSSLWVVAIAKGWATLNIVDRLEPIGKLGRQKKIYNNETTLDLMAATLENAKTQTYLAPMALGFFGCMRPEEITSEKPKATGLPVEKWFGWKDIDLKNGLVSVSVDVAKTGDERVIRLQPCAIEWLKLAQELGCPLPPVDEFRTARLICELIGLDDWIRDGLRKNCATHLRAVYKNDYEVVKDLGNSVRVMVKAYAELRTPEAISLEHWMITPGKVKEYRKSRKWLKVLRDAADKAAIAAASKPPEPSASENAKSER